MSTVIDAHQHVFWQGKDDAGLVADMDDNGISLAWLLSWEIAPGLDPAEMAKYAGILNRERLRPDGSHPGILLPDLLTADRHFPGRFRVGYCPDPGVPGAGERFEEACERWGVCVCGEWKFRQWIDADASLDLFRAAGRRKAPVVLHLDVPWLPPRGGSAYPGWFGGTVENLARVLDECPDTCFIGHAPGFWREISGDADSSAEVYPSGPVVPGGRLERLLERYPNLHGDLSAGSALVALRRDIGFTKEFLTRFSDRLLFGRDGSGGELLAFLRSLDLPADVEESILFKNATRLVP